MDAFPWPRHGFFPSPKFWIKTWHGSMLSFSVDMRKNRVIRISVIQIEWNIHIYFFLFRCASHIHMCWCHGDHVKANSVPYLNHISCPLDIYPTIHTFIILLLSTQILSKGGVRLNISPKSVDIVVAIRPCSHLLHYHWHPIPCILSRLAMLQHPIGFPS
jgi:hypothetical protein